MHLVELVDLWERYIDAAYKDRAPKCLSRHPQDLGVQVAGHTFAAENRSYTNTITPTGASWA